MTCSCGGCDTCLRDQGYAYCPQCESCDCIDPERHFAVGDDKRRDNE